MNDENLSPLGNGTRTKSEEREIQRRGGINSGISRRRKRDARNIMLQVLQSMPKLDKKTVNNLHQLGIMGEGSQKNKYDIEIIMAAAIAQKAMKGDVRAFNAILQTIGEDARSRIIRESLGKEEQEDGILKIVYDYDGSDGTEDDDDGD